MSRPETESLAPLARRDDEPVFDEPWQAQALGLAFSLAERGVFAPDEWSRALGKAHRALLVKGAPDTPQTYYEAVAVALERLVGESGVCTPEALEQRTHDWRQAYLSTPHGKPVELNSGFAKS